MVSTSLMSTCIQIIILLFLFLRTTVYADCRIKCSWEWLKFRCSDGCEWFPQCGGQCLIPAGARPPLLPTTKVVMTKRENWMTEFHNKKLGNLILPGTHHSGLDYEIEGFTKAGSEWDFTQRLSIADQLILGIRFFDFRVATKYAYDDGQKVRYFSDGPKVTHNWTYHTLKYLLDQMVNFLNGAGQSETVVVRIIDGKTDTLHLFGLVSKDYITDWSEVNTLVRKYEANIYTGSESPLTQNLSSLKGKIVFCSSKELKGFQYVRVDCTGSFATTESRDRRCLMKRMDEFVSSATRSDVKFNFLEIFCTPTTTMIEDDLIPGQCRHVDDQRYHTYHGLEDLAEECNWYIRTKLHERTNGVRKIKSYASKFQGVLFDFVHTDNVKLVIDANK